MECVVNARGIVSGRPALGTWPSQATMGLLVRRPTETGWEGNQYYGHRLSGAGIGPLVKDAKKLSQFGPRPC
jgi:hypothetical protein